MSAYVKSLLTDFITDAISEVVYLVYMLKIQISKIQNQILNYLKSHKVTSVQIQKHSIFSFLTIMYNTDLKMLNYFNRRSKFTALCSQISLFLYQDFPIFFDNDDTKCYHIKDTFPQ